MRKAIFNLVENLSQYELSPTGQKLVLHYFNESKAPDTYERALDAIERYIPEKLPGPDDTSPRLQRLLDELKRESAVWDAES